MVGTFFLGICFWQTLDSHATDLANLYFSVLQWKHGRARRLLASCVAVVGLGSHINTRECSMISLIGSLVILRWFSGARATSAPAAAPAKPTPAMVFRTSLPESTLLPTPGPTFRAEATFLPTRGPTFRAEATVPRGEEASGDGDDNGAADNSTAFAVTIFASAALSVLVLCAGSILWRRCRHEWARRKNPAELGRANRAEVAESMEIGEFTEANVSSRTREVAKRDKRSFKQGTECFSTQAIDSPSGTSFRWRSRRNLFGQEAVGPSSPPLPERGDLISTEHPEQDPPALQHQPALDTLPEESVDAWGAASSVPLAGATEETRRAPPQLRDPSSLLGAGNNLDGAKEYSSTDQEDSSATDENTGALVAAGDTTQADEAGAKGNISKEIAEYSTTDKSKGFSAPFYGGDDPGAVVAVSHVAQADDSAESALSRKPRADGVGVVEAVVEAAHELATHSAIPGVSEAARLVSILVRLVTDHRGGCGEVEWRVKRCRSIIFMLNRAGQVLGKGGETNGEAERASIEDVHDAVADLVEIIKTYRSKHKMAQVMTSTIFKRRQEEAEALIDRAVSHLHLGLQVHVGQNLNRIERKLDQVGQDTEGIHHERRSSEEAVAMALADARLLRRKRNLDLIEIPDDQVTLTDELLGKGGFGAVYLVDFNGRNAAAKVLLIDHELGRPNRGSRSMGLNHGTPQAMRVSRQRKAFLKELGAMMRLRSPHTVGVYGAITSRNDRLVLVMELLSGGDLHAFLKAAKDPLPVGQVRRIIGDVCAGMAFVHSRGAVHGDLKSANVLLDGTGRAKIGDFGTSKWIRHNSTGLATLTTKASHNNQMSFAWASPEVLEAKGTSSASDVYSLGMVAWEVLSREVPWASESLPRDIYVRVVFKGDRPPIPIGTPADIAGMIRSCWAGVPEDRSTSSELLRRMRSSESRIQS